MTDKKITMLGLSLTEDEMRRKRYTLHISEKEREIIVSALSVYDNELGLSPLGHELKGSLHLKLTEQAQ